MSDDPNFGAKLWARVRQWADRVQSHPVKNAVIAMVVFGAVVVLLSPNLSLNSVLGRSIDELQRAVETATGLPGVAIVAVYSFLIAFVLPLPSEVVLVAPLALGLPEPIRFALIMVVSGLGKAAGSVLALRVGMTAKESGPVLRAFERLGVTSSPP